ncbi:MAG: CpaF family protein [Halobacteriovoraceae bacterium]|nr:CpaF family protein [Halobacteriovoraceae bacterium]MCB9094140.1 CpaF family protein [Halobacteriovoraceae bacterium]
MSVFSEAIDNFLSPIADLLKDDKISEIMVNGASEIYVEKQGKILKVDNKFRDEENLMSALRAIAQTVGKKFDRENPQLDAHLPDGSRIAAVMMPISQKGTTFSIRKFFKEKVLLKDLIKWGALSKDAARFLDICVYLGKNMIISGGTGSGKTTLLNILSSRIPVTQRIVLIEDTKEVNLDSNHVVHLVTRKEDPTQNIKPVTIRDLLHSAMRLRPDRIIVGEVRGGEALDLINAMNTGHEGSMGTVHANNPEEAALRLETLCLLEGTQIPYTSLRQMIGHAVSVIVQMRRYSDGLRRVSNISEVLGVDNNGRYIIKDIFTWVQKGKNDKTGELLGEIVPCHYLPSFFNEIVVNKLPFPAAKFEAPDWVKPLKKKKAA